MIWEVEMCRISEGFRTLLVEAKTRDEALEKAYDEAGDYEYSEKNVNYEVQTIRKHKK